MTTLCICASVHLLRMVSRASTVLYFIYSCVQRITEECRLFSALVKLAQVKIFIYPHNGFVLGECQLVLGKTHTTKALAVRAACDLFELAHVKKVSQPVIRFSSFEVCVHTVKLKGKFVSKDRSRAI